MVYEGVGNYSNTTTSEDTTESRHNYRSLSLYELTFSWAALFGMCGNFIIAYVIFRHKRMRTIPNIILANWAIAQFCYLASSTETYAIIWRIHLKSYEFSCIFFEAATTFHVAGALAVLALALDWCFAAYFENVSANFRNYSKYVIASIWVGTLLIYVITITLCATHTYLFYYRHNPLFAAYVAILVFVVSLQCYRLVQKLKGKLLNGSPLMLNIISVCMVCWFFDDLYLCAYLVAEATDPIWLIIGKCIIHGSSIFVLIMLIWQDSTFRACFLRSCKRTNNIDNTGTESLSYNPTPRSAFTESAEILLKT